MILQELREIVKGLPSGGYLSSDQRESNEFIDKLINTGRAVVIPQIYSRTRKFLPIWVQSFTPEYSKLFQDGYKGSFMFIIPPVIGLGPPESGYEYIGSTDCNIQMRVWTNRSKFTSAISDRLMNPTSGRKTNILFEGANVGEVYSQLGLKTAPVVRAIYANPMDIPTYNIMKDNYPLDEGSIKELVNYLEKTDMMILTKSFFDRVNQGKDNSPNGVPQLR